MANNKFCKNGHDLDEHGRIDTRGSTICKPCEAEYKRKWATQSSKKDKRVNNGMYNKLVHRYGITYDEFFKILKVQKFKCPICKVKLKKKDRFNTVVDHNHITGKVRGLLCRMCNSGLGHFKDNQILLEQAILYLRENA